MASYARSMQPCSAAVLSVLPLPSTPAQLAVGARELTVDGEVIVVVVDENDRPHFEFYLTQDPPKCTKENPVELGMMKQYSSQFAPFNLGLVVGKDPDGDTIEYHIQVPSFSATCKEDPGKEYSTDSECLEDDDTCSKWGNVQDAIEVVTTPNRGKASVRWSAPPPGRARRP